MEHWVRPDAGGNNDRRGRKGCLNERIENLSLREPSLSTVRTDELREFILLK